MKKPVQKRRCVVRLCTGIERNARARTERPHSNRTHSQTLIGERAQQKHHRAHLTIRSFFTCWPKRSRTDRQSKRKNQLQTSNSNLLQKCARVSLSTCRLCPPERYLLAARLQAFSADSHGRPCCADARCHAKCPMLGTTKERHCLVCSVFRAIWSLHYVWHSIDLAHELDADRKMHTHCDHRPNIKSQLTTIEY